MPDSALPFAPLSVAVPREIVALAEAVRDVGGRALLVGGGVRDAWLGRSFHDWDVEVYGIPEEDLARLLGTLGHVNAVGRSFGVFKVRIRQLELDVSLPRRDSKVGAGHRGIQVEGDPAMAVMEAARRRDLTMNAIMYDPLTGETLDPWNGRADLVARRLRAVDEQTFLEDPLRALRVVQFAARLEFTPDEVLVGLAAQAALDELPAERIQGEWVKLLLQGARPSLGLAFAGRAGMVRRVFPEWAAVDDGEAGPLDRFAEHVRPGLESEGRALAVGVAVWLHHATVGIAEATLDRLGLHRWKGYPLRERVLAILANADQPWTTDRDLRWLSTRVELRAFFSWVAACHPELSVSSAVHRAGELGILEKSPEPLLQGRDLQRLGVMPGPAMGSLLRALYALQLDGEPVDLHVARSLAEEVKVTGE